MKKLSIFIIFLLSVFVAQAQFSVNSSGKASVGTYKMKNRSKIFNLIIFFVAILISGTEVRADSTDFFVIGKTWIEGSYTPNYFSQGTITTYEVTGTTKVNGITYYQLNYTSVPFSGGNATTGKFGLFRQDGEQIYRYWESIEEESLYFDFGLGIGEIFYPHPTLPAEDYNGVEVINVYTETFNGTKRKCLGISNVGSKVVKDVWIEGVGSKEGGISSNNTIHSVGQENWLISCSIGDDYLYGEPMQYSYRYEYIPLLQEGEIWNYGSHEIWLSGEKEIGGKTYKICYCDTDIRKSAEELKPYAYLREEDKRVYLRIPENNVTYDAEQRPLWYGYDKSKVNDEEILIYDFNLKIGDACPEVYRYFNEPVNIISVDYVLVGGKMRRRFNLSVEGSYLIEGIGIYGVVNVGHMAYPFAYDNTSANDILPPDLYRFSKEGGRDILGGASAPMITDDYNSLLTEGIVWNYYESIGRDNPPLEYARLTLSGDKEINGKSYKNCWLWYDDCTFSKQTSKLVCYLREENGCVYAIVDGDCDTQNMFINYESVGEEHLIYDFNLNVGDESVMGEISAIEFVVIDGELRKKYIIENAHKEYIEGIGTVGEYSLYFCCPDCPLPTSGYKAPSLNYVSNFDGRLIYAEDDDWNGDPCKEGGNAIESIVDDVASILIGLRNNTICVKANGEGKIALSVYDLVGVKVAEASGEGEVLLSTDTLPIGIYIVKATSDNGIETAEKKIVIK